MMEAAGAPRVRCAAGRGHRRLRGHRGPGQAAHSRPGPQGGSPSRMPATETVGLLHSGAADELGVLLAELRDADALAEATTGAEGLSRGLSRVTD